MGIVSTIPELCKRCYSCVRDCPTKAIKVERGQATVIEERCIACGNCVKVCAQGAKRIEDGTATVKEMISRGDRVVACLAPSFPAVFDLSSHLFNLYRWCYAPSDTFAFEELTPFRVIAALRELGFYKVWEVAFGAELVSREYRKLFEKTRGRASFLISSPCPAIVSYVEKHMPGMTAYLAPIVSPMIATARAVRKRYGDGVKIVFIGPCVAKKQEINDPDVADDVDAVLTFAELTTMFGEAGILPHQLRESYVDNPPVRYGGSYPLSGGLLKTSGLSADILENEIVTTDGKEHVLSALNDIKAGRSQTRFFDLLFCEGCINGPVMLNDMSPMARKEILVSYINNLSPLTTPDELDRALDEYKDLDLSRRFTQPPLEVMQPHEEEIRQVLTAMKKLDPKDHLNCGACGYPTCRDKAVAVCQGLAEAEMCLPYLVEELQATCERLQFANEDLAGAQERLIQTEKLASMGQLSAGVAHEINNPLGTILIYSHMMIKRLSADDPRRTDLEMIVNEATRCKTIVRGLLDFARQSRVSKTPTDPVRLVRHVVDILKTKAEEAGVELRAVTPAELPMVLADRDQCVQMLVNIVHNAIDAAGEGGHVRVSAGASNGSVGFEIEDDGCGIPAENLKKIFTPFFTTKEMGKGTGLGLAIAYGVVKMHCGDITVNSEIDKGTTFRITIPVGQAEAGSDLSGAPFVTNSAVNLQ